MRHMVVHDAEELSHALQHTDVTAMQIDRGRFVGQLAQYALMGWSFQHVGFEHGRATCRGSSPSQQHAFVVPLCEAPDFRLLGKEVTPNSYALYSPNSEHADTTGPGVREMVLIPGRRTIERIERQLARRLPTTGSYNREVSTPVVQGVRTALSDLHRAACVDPSVLEESAVAHSIIEGLELQLTEMLSAVEPREARGRPQLPRSSILRRLNDRLNSTVDDSLYASELCDELGISFPTLRRVFIDWFGMPPARYLLLRRYYLARQRLRDDRFSTVTSVAYSCGFWDLSRFSESYRALFHEPPSATLRKRRASGPPK